MIRPDSRLKYYQFYSPLLEVVDNPILWLLCEEAATPFIPVERKNQAFLPPLQWGEILSEFIVLFSNTGDPPLKQFYYGGFHFSKI